jgi:hypothetical protein
MEDNNRVVQSVPNKGLITDIHEDLVPGEYWTHARNAALNSHLGQASQLQSEPSNTHCVDLPYTVIGFIKLTDNRWVVFTTDNTDSEIGIFDESACTYTKLVNAKCLNFNTASPIEGQSKVLSDCKEAIYWTDARNPRRYLDITEVPYVYSVEDDACKTKKYTTIVDCDEMLMDKKVSVPTINVRKSVNGDLKNGVYQFGIAYADNGSRISDYYSITSPQSIWTHENYGQAIDLDIVGLDRDFDEYELIVIYTIKGVDNYKSLGFFSTAEDRQHISSVERAEYTPIDVKEILVKRPKYPYADGIEANDQYLLWYGLRTTPELNYQIQAMNILSKYVVYEVPADYYLKGGTKVGYMRDEVYAFGIQWLMDTGEWSSAFHIPGGTETKIDSNAAGRDVYELTMRDKGLVTEIDVPVWRAENTATPFNLINQPTGVDEKIIGEGLMGYWESSNLYPDNVAQFGEAKCTPIRHCKMPDNATTHIYSNEGKNIRILGIKFENIEHPLDSNGLPIKNVKGYRIVRSDRRGNKSVVAKGVFTNVRAYNEDNKVVLYANYPFNDLRQDNFLSSKQPYFNNGEKDFRPLTEYRKDQFNFYSPETSFQHISLGQEVKLYTEEHAKVKGFFEEVYKHPKQKLLTQFDLYFALIIGALDGYYAMKGKTCVTKVGKQELTLGVGANVINTPSGPNLPSVTPIPGQVAANTQVSACDDALEFTSALSADPTKIKGVERVLRGLAKAGVFAFFALKTANAVLDIIANVSPWQQYALQYNSHGLFNSFTPVPRGNRRRFLEYYQYIFDGLNTVQGTTFNNFKREDSVYLKFHDSVEPPSREDTSRNTLTDLKLCDDFRKPVENNASLFYGAVKKPIPNQYGHLDSIRYLDTGYFVTELAAGDDLPVYGTDVVFGGDVYINKMSIKRSHNYFSTYLQEVSDGFVLDYRNYRNVGYPRYWMDSSPYDMTNFISQRPTMSRTPRQKHNLSCQGQNSTNGVSVVKDRYFYLFNSGVMEFFVESEQNIAYRDWKGNECNFYGNHNTDLSTLFRADKIAEREEFTYDNTYNKQLIENNIIQQRLDFNPVVEKTCSEYSRNKIIYSLPHQQGSKRDNWKIYLTNNFYEFPESEFGKLTAIHGVDNQQLMFLFDKSAPYISIGRDEIKMDGSGRKITIGDGGLFAREPRPIAFTDMQYGNCQNRWAFVNTQFGSFYPSQRQGRIFSTNGQALDEISRNGINFWTKQYMPSKLLEAFPNYIHKDNPVKGVSMLSSFDNTNEVYYLSKKDWAVKPGVTDLIYDEVKDEFRHGGRVVELGDAGLFDDASWTISYAPANKAFISYHDWHPAWMLQGERHFLSVKDGAIWKHNETSGSFCKFFNVDFPYEVELPINNNGEIDVMRSIEYHLQVGKYFNNGRDFHHVLDDNFDFATVHNSEQISGRMKMILQSKKDLTQLFGYPKMDAANELVHILYNKEEHRYRINQFTDIVKDRGEFTNRMYPLILTQPNGYIRDINSSAIDFGKPVQHRKKFRHKSNRLWLTKNKCADKKFIFNFAIAKQIKSDR